MFAGDGEPLLNPKNEIIEDARNHSIDTSFTTNGVHINDKFISESLKSFVGKGIVKCRTKESYEKIHRTNEKISKESGKILRNVFHIEEGRL